MMRATMSAPRRPFALCVALILAGCGILPQDAGYTEAERAELDRLAAQVIDYTQRESEAYLQNTLLNFAQSAQSYRGVSAVEKQLYPLDRGRAAVTAMHIAINSSNLGDHERARAIIDAARDTVLNEALPTDRAKALLFSAQVELNRDNPVNGAERSIAEAEKAIALLDGMIADFEARESAGASGPEVGFRRIDGALWIDQRAERQINLLGGRGLGSTSAVPPLTEIGRLRLQRAHARYVLARARDLGGEDLSRVEPLVDSSLDDIAQVRGDYGNWLRAQGLAFKASLLSREGDFVAALDLLDSALAIEKQVASNTRPVALLLFQRGEVLLELAAAPPPGRSAGDLSAEAQEAYRRAIAIFKNDRQGLGPKRARSVLQLLLSEHAVGREGADDELFQAMQKVRSSSTAEIINRLNARLNSGTGDAAELIRRADRLERVVNSLETRHDDLIASRSQDVHLVAVTTDRLQRRTAELAAVRQEIATRVPNYGQLVDQVLDLPTAQAKLAPDEVMAIVQLSAEGGIVALVSRTGFDAYEIGLTIADAEKRVAEFRQSIHGRPQDPLFHADLDAAHTLYEDIFGPARAQIEAAGHLIVVPTYSLFSLPFSALLAAPHEGEIGIEKGYFDYSEVDFLGRTTPVSVGVSISSFFLGRDVPWSSGQKPFIGFGDFRPAGDIDSAARAAVRLNSLPAQCRDTEAFRVYFDSARVPPLPGTAAELTQAARIFDVPEDQIVTGARFTDAAVKSAPLSDYRIIHIATHGTPPLAPECLDEFVLTTTPTDSDDGLLTASEIIDLTLDAELVVLSACDTAAGGGGSEFRTAGGRFAKGGESLGGIARSFFYAGGRRVLPTLWAVDDQSMGTLLTGFYGALSKGGDVTPATALRDAQAKMIAGGTDSHPYFWAPMIMVGDGARPLQQ